ncbi:MAG TPA: PrpF domain-containing protein, partial [Thermomonas sp.]|nr:PrpF domain-containing protein [Thermomonas sp.]
FLREWLPQDDEARDQALIGAIGASDPLQLDGLGGGSTLNSKVAIVSICLSGQVSFPRCSDAPNVTGPLSASMLAGIDAGIAPRRGQRINCRRECLGIGQHRHDVLERDPGLGEIGDGADQCGPVGHGRGVGEGWKKTPSCRVPRVWVNVQKKRGWQGHPRKWGKNA